ncbi:MAG: low affinity iron permease family protein [Rhodospirillaceae bacterium]|nr:low affinity iron permease family protein [Rhodospirillaceae bacterium]
MSLSQKFTTFANAIARTTGKPMTFVLCCATVVVWAACGPVFGFSETWQLLINTGTTIITFLMVFLIQNTQNRDSAAIQVKLDELLRSHRPASDAFIGVEHLTEEELEELRSTCEAAATVARKKAGRRKAG